MNCVACDGRVRRHGGRGLCMRCYDAHDYAGTLVDFERSTHSCDDVLAEWELLRPHGHKRRDVAQRLGMTLAAFERACTRARHQTPRPAFAGRGE